MGGPLDGRRELSDELRHHIDERTERLMAEGLDRATARRKALEAFGDVDAVLEELESIDSRRIRGSEGLLDRLSHDAGFALRQLRRSPGFAVLAVLTLGLGIGAATAIFSVVKAVVLDPLPYPAPERLVHLRQVTPEGSPFSVSVPDFADFRDRIGAFQELAASSRADFALQADGEPVRLVANQVSPGFFRVFAGDPLLGRALVEEEGAPDPAPVAVLSHRLWQSRFGGDREVLGRSLVLDGTAVTVVGVMPPAWEPLMETDLWVPLPVGPGQASREDHFLDVAGRLRDDVGLEAARAEARQVARALAAEHPAANEGWGVRLTPLKEILVGPERIRAGWMLLGAVGLLLLLACASVSNLLIARAGARGREMGLRAALGAGRGRLVQQLLTESLVLAGLGAGVGLALAFLAVPLLQGASPAGTPRIHEAAVNGPVILFCLGVSLSTGLIFGLTPVLHVTRRDPSAALSSDPRTAAPGGGGLRSLLVAGQVALTVTLLAGAGLLGTSFLRMQGTGTGLPLEGGWAVPLMMPGARYDSDGRARAAREIRERIEAIPGVAAAGISNVRPFSGANTAIDLNVEGRAAVREEAPFVRWRIVDPGFFQVLNDGPLHGRALEAADYAPGAERVAVVSESLARSVFGASGDALGRRIAMGWNGTNWWRIVGVIPDVEDVGVAEEPPRALFLPGLGAWNWVVLLVRMEEPSAPVPRHAVQEAVWEVDPGLPVPVVEALDDRFGEAVAAPGFNLLILSVFAGVALVLALLGVYGVTLLAVTHRTREIGVRIALGADPREVLGLAVRRGAGVALAGVVAGLVMAAGLSRFLEAILFRTRALDPWALGGAALVVGVAAVAATFLPARRATRVDPVEVLGAE